MEVQSQRGGSDYYLFAVAYAMSLCMRTDPHTQRYAQTVMREHLARYKERSLIFHTVKGKCDLKDRIMDRKKVDVFCISRFLWDRYERKRRALVRTVQRVELFEH